MIGREKNKDANKNKAENKSMILRTSPVITNMPFRNRSTAQKRVN